MFALMFMCTYVVGLEISVEDPVGVAAPDPGNNLAEERPDQGEGQPDPLRNIIRLRLRPIHEGLEIVRDVFEDQIQSARLRLDNIEELYLCARRGEED